MFIKDFEACIFDLDGTLIDSMWIWRDLDKVFFADYNIEFPSDYMENIQGLSVVDVAKYTVDTFHFPLTYQEAVEEWNKRAYEYYRNKIVFKDGAEDFLKYLRKNNIKTGIATSNSTHLFQAVYDNLKLQNFIDCFVTGEMVSRGKPDPECFLKVADMLKTKPEKCLVFEDVREGIEGAGAAGMKAVNVWDELTSYQWEEKKKLSILSIKSFGELMDVCTD